MKVHGPSRGTSGTFRHTCTGFVLHGRIDFSCTPTPRPRGGDVPPQVAGGEGDPPHSTFVASFAPGRPYPLPRLCGVVQMESWKMFPSILVRFQRPNRGGVGADRSENTVSTHVVAHLDVDLSPDRLRRHAHSHERSTEADGRDILGIRTCRWSALVSSPWCNDLGAPAATRAGRRGSKIPLHVAVVRTKVTWSRSEPGLPPLTPSLRSEGGHSGRGTKEKGGRTSENPTLGSYEPCRVRKRDPEAVRGGVAIRIGFDREGCRIRSGRFPPWRRRWSGQGCAWTSWT